MFVKKVISEEYKKIKDMKEWCNMGINIRIRLTNTAIRQIRSLLGEDDEYSNRGYYIINRIFENEYYDCYLQNSTRKKDIETKISILLAGDTKNENNKKVIDTYGGTIVLDGVNKAEDTSFLVTNIRKIPKKVGSKSNKSIFEKIKFSMSRIDSSEFPEYIVEKIEKLTNAREFSEKVAKAIRDWDNYLAIIEEEAEKSLVEIEYSGYKQEEALNYCVFKFDEFTKEQEEKLKQFRNERITLFYKKNEYGFKEKYTILNEEGEKIVKEIEWEDIEESIGVLEKINYKKYTIKIELTPEQQEIAIEGRLVFPKKAKLRISKVGDLAQARNLRRGLNKLKNGESHNHNLDSLLFDSKNIKENIEGNLTLSEDELLLKTLNENQKLAVEGVLNTKDLFLIQGPPGTGKTTVISEICYQNAVRGKKTLISSQSNLAVDNAMSRLIQNPKIRALRMGNLARVEKEGEMYTEKNVVNTWLRKTADSCSEEFNIKKEYLKKILEVEKSFDRIQFIWNKHNQLVEDIKDKKRLCEEKSRKLEKIKLEKSNINLILKELKEKIWLKTNLYDIEDEGKNIFDMISGVEKNLLKIEDDNNILDKSILGKLINKLNLSRIEKNNKRLNLKKVEKNNKIKEYIDNQELELLEKILPSRYRENVEFMRGIELAKKENEVRKTVFKKINNINIQANKIKKNIEILKELERQHKIKKLIPSVNLIRKYDADDIKSFEKESIEIYNFRPNRFLSLIGLNKEWKIKVLNELRRGQNYINLLKDEIETLEAINKSHIDRIMIYLECLINQFKIDEKIIKNKDKEITNKLNNIVESIVLLENEYEIKKEQIIYQIEMNIKSIIEGILECKTINEESKAIIKNIKKEIFEFNIEIEKLIGCEVRERDIDKRNIKKSYESLIEEKKKITSNYVEIVGTWIKRIKNEKYGNKEELQQAYIDEANVIGITCVQSGRKDFTERYPNFDVVIVDEVSKATPPELVLPMLKGKKVVLVGDHKQLPPMIGDETFAELKSFNEQNNELQEDELDTDLSHMEKSIFEEIFNNIEANSKIMLNTQYRMHSSIMNTINQFYKDSDSDGLKCGVIDEEISKNHKISTEYFDTSNNLLWVDIPLNDENSEKRNTQNSFYNEAEIKVIDKILTDIDCECEKSQVRKNVAVITFYGAQAKKLQREIGKKFKNIKVRVGTVDRFQGMESEIVIVSFVRNNNNKNIGFARDPKRINVALSRAQKLLIIVGCSELFCEKNFNRQAKKDYNNVRKVVNEYEGIIDAIKVFN